MLIYKYYDPSPMIAQKQFKLAKKMIDEIIL